MQEIFHRAQRELDLPRPPEQNPIRSKDAMTHTSNVGRNDLCTCGSGKKFKKCHGLKQQSNRGNMLMLIIVSLLVVAGAAAVVTSFTSDRSHVGRPGGVWSPEHGHYH